MHTCVEKLAALWKCAALNVMLWFGQVCPLVDRCSPQWNYCLSRAWPRISNLISTSFECYSKKVISICHMRTCVVRFKWVCTSKMFKLSNVLFLCESLGDQAWMLFFDLQRLPWVAVVLNLTYQNWHLDECWVYCKWNRRRLSRYLFIACLHAQEDDVGRSTSQAAFQVGLTANLFSLCIVAVERLHRYFKQAPLDLCTTVSSNQWCFIRRKTIMKTKMIPREWINW